MRKTHPMEQMMWEKTVPDWMKCHCIDEVIRTMKNHPKHKHLDTMIHNDLVLCGLHGQYQEIVVKEAKEFMKGDYDYLKLVEKYPERDPHWTGD